MSESSKLIEEYIKLHQEVARKQKELVGKLANKSGEIFAGVFEAHPNLEGFGWRQYTPYFNDGDTCTFSAHIDEPDIHIDGEIHDGYEIWYDDSADEEEKKKSKTLVALQKDVSKVLGQFPQDLLESLYGDHSQVSVTKTDKGIVVETDSYDHE